MKYDISKSKVPEISGIGKGQKASKMHQIPVLLGLKRHVWTSFSMLFPILGAQVSDVEFQQSDLIWKELCGQMAHLEAKSGGDKG